MRNRAKIRVLAGILTAALRMAAMLNDGSTLVFLRFACQFLFFLKKVIVYSSLPPLLFWLLCREFGTIVVA